jgi:hypothetical protein
MEEMIQHSSESMAVHYFRPENVYSSTQQIAHYIYTWLSSDSGSSTPIDVEVTLELIRQHLSQILNPIILAHDDLKRQKIAEDLLSRVCRMIIDKHKAGYGGNAPQPQRLFFHHIQCELCSLSLCICDCRQ